MPSPLAGHAVNPSLGARWRHPCRHTVPQSARTPHQTVGRWSREKLLSCQAHRHLDWYTIIQNARHALLLTVHPDHLDWSLPAHRRGTLSGMDAALEPTRTYLRRVPRWWAGKGPAAKPQHQCSTPALPHRFTTSEQARFCNLASSDAASKAQSTERTQQRITRFTASAPELPHTALDAAMIDCASPARLDSAFTRAKAAGDRSQ